MMESEVFIGKGKHMIVTKRSLLRFLCVVQIVVFAFTYMFGSHGIIAARALKKEIADVQLTIAQNEKEIEQLRTQIRTWQTDDFYIEKLAREELQMARPSEQVYVIIKEVITDNL